MAATDSQRDHREMKMGMDTEQEKGLGDGKERMDAEHIEQWSMGARFELANNWLPDNALFPG